MNKKGPDFLQFDSPWFFDPGTIRLPSPPEDRAWRRPPGAREQARWRSHTFSRPNSSVGFICSQCSVQSVMNLDEPHALVSAYTRKMMGFMLFKPSPKRIVMLGLGGGSLAKFCYRYLPKTQITVVEIDERVIALRDEFCVPADDHRFRIVYDDGARYISNLSERIDVVMVDAFDAIGLAPTLAATDFYAQAARRLSPSGLLVMNFSGDPARYRTHTERIRAAFGGSRLLVPVLEEDNLLLFASNQWIPLLTSAKYENRAQRLQSRLGLEFPRYLRRICQGRVLA